MQEGGHERGGKVHRYIHTSTYIQYIHTYKAIPFVLLHPISQPANSPQKKGCWTHNTVLSHVIHPTLPPAASRVKWRREKTARLAPPILPPEHRPPPPPPRGGGGPQN